MAIRELLRALEKDAEAKVTALRTAARAAADQLIVEATARLDRRRAEDLAAREAELRATASGAIETARQEATSRALVARGEVLDRVFTRARTLLTTLEPEMAFQATVRYEIDAALLYLGASAAVVCCSPAWSPLLTRALRGRAGIRLEVSNDLGAGMIVRALDGRVEIDATLARRLDQLWPRLAIDLVRGLEAGE